MQLAGAAGAAELLTIPALAEVRAGSRRREWVAAFVRQTPAGSTD